MNKEILVLGKGWLGTRIAEYLDCQSSGSRINSYDDIQKVVDQYKPKVVINCIGNVKKTVDSCEANKTETVMANTVIPILLAESALRNKFKLVQISSGDLFLYDYKEDRPVKETDQPNFFDLFYSRCKEYAETSLLALGSSANILILRVRYPLDYIPHEKNLLDRLRELKNIVDVENSITYVPDFLEMLKHLIKNDAFGVYNCVNYGGLKYKELLEVYREFNTNHSYAIASPGEIKSVRTNLLLSTDKLEESGFDVRDIHDVLRECVTKWVAIAKGADVRQAEQIKISTPGALYDQTKERK